MSHEDVVVVRLTNEMVQRLSTPDVGTVRFSATEMLVTQWCGEEGRWVGEAVPTTGIECYDGSQRVGPVVSRYYLRAGSDAATRLRESSRARVRSSTVTVDDAPAAPAPKRRREKQPAAAPKKVVKGEKALVCLDLNLTVADVRREFETMDPRRIGVYYRPNAVAAWQRQQTGSLAVFVVFQNEAVAREAKQRATTIKGAVIVDDVAHADAFGIDMSEDREEPLGERARRFFDQFPPFDSDVLGSLRSPSDVKYNPELGFDLERALAVYHDWRQHLDRIERAILAHSIVAETPPFLTAVKTALAAELDLLANVLLDAKAATNLVRPVF